MLSELSVSRLGLHVHEENSFGEYYNHSQMSRAGREGFASPLRSVDIQNAGND